MIRAFLCVALVACGDNLPLDLELEPSSGTRLQLTWALYDDGSRQLDPSAFYDVRLHARCTPQPWIDDVLRCVPDADDVVFQDSACTVAVGRVRTIEKPTHFLHHERRGDGWVPARVFRAGTEKVELALHWQLRAGACVGPFFPPKPAATYFEISGEIGGEELVAFTETELGDDRLALRMRTTEDGVRAPLGLRDRELAIDCAPSASGTGAVACEPLQFADATLFGDPECRLPALATATAPAIARVAQPSGCADYHAVAAETGPVVYQRAGDRCARATLLADQRAFLVGDRLALPAIERVVEARAGSRLERVLLVDGELRFAHDRLHDSATRADCQPVAWKDGLRCIPVAHVPARMLYAVGCAFEVRLAELPERSCERPAFALARSADVLDVHAIGDAFTGEAYAQTAAGCIRYTPPSGMSLHELGPPLALDTFVRGHWIGER